MKNNKETVIRYFELVDNLKIDSKEFEEFLSLYSDTIESHSNDGTISVGIDELRKNLITFYTGMEGGESRHFYVITDESQSVIEVDWAVSAFLPNKTVVALQGHNRFEFDGESKIKKLVVANA